MNREAVFHDYYLRVAFGDTDTARIVFYPNFYRWMDRATHEFFDQISIDSIELMEQNLGFPLFETQCKYFSSLRFHDYVRIRSTIEEIRNKSVTIRHDFYKRDSNTLDTPSSSDILVASGYEVRVWVEFLETENKATPIPEDIRKKLLGEVSMRV